MADSNSDTTDEKAEPREYTIDLDDMRSLKKKVAALEGKLRKANHPGGYQPSSTIIKTVSDIKEHLHQIKPAGAFFSPGPAGFGYARNLVSDEFVTEGCERMLEQVYKDLEKLKAEGDVAAGYVYHFVEDYDVITLVEHVRIKVCEAMDEDLDFVYDFGPRVREMAMDSLLGEAEYAGMRDLKEKLTGTKSGR